MRTCWSVSCTSMSLVMPAPGVTSCSWTPTCLCMRRRRAAFWRSKTIYRYMALIATFMNDEALPVLPLHHIFLTSTYLCMRRRRRAALEKQNHLHVCGINWNLEWWGFSCPHIISWFALSIVVLFKLDNVICHVDNNSIAYNWQLSHRTISSAGHHGHCHSRVSKFKNSLNTKSPTVSVARL